MYTKNCYSKSRAAWSLDRKKTDKQEYFFMKKKKFIREDREQARAPVINDEHDTIQFNSRNSCPIR